jgi:hypothetical protein
MSPSQVNPRTLQTKGVRKKTKRAINAYLKLRDDDFAALWVQYTNSPIGSPTTVSR